jgi:hypothetical protein
MSEAKGPYKIGRPEEYEGEGGYVSERLIGPGLGRWGAPEISDPMTDEEQASLVATANAIYSAGRSSRDGLWKALETVLKAGNLAWAWEEAKEALEADGEGEK